MCELKFIKIEWGLTKLLQNIICCNFFAHVVYQNIAIVDFAANGKLITPISNFWNATLNQVLLETEARPQTH